MLPDQGAEEEKERGLRSAEANVAKADNDQAEKNMTTKIQKIQEKRMKSRWIQKNLTSSHIVHSYIRIHPTLD
jgi:hypothetical protein